MCLGTALGASLTAHSGKSYTLWAELVGATDDEVLESFGGGDCS